MELQSGTDIAMGPRMMSSDTRDNRSVPEWIEESILPKARDDRKPLLDIYAEIIRLRESMARLEAAVTIAEDIITENGRKLDIIFQVIQRTWYMRAYYWFTGRLSRLKEGL